MSPAHRAPFSLRRWLALLFRQPPQGLYRRPCLYQSGDRMEIEHFDAENRSPEALTFGGA